MPGAIAEVPEAVSRPCAAAVVESDSLLWSVGAFMPCGYSAKLRGQVVPQPRDEPIAQAGEEPPSGGAGSGCHGRSRASLRPRH
jgi:hypothetical protein